jgi:hypothetical protein
MEAKEIIGLIVLFLFLVLVQFVSAPKRKQGEMQQKAPPPAPYEKRKEKALHRREEKVISAKKQKVEKNPLEQKEKVTSQVIVEKTKKEHPIKERFSDKHSLRQAFLMQEIFKRPYE